jgi:hypothetical protein
MLLLQIKTERMALLQADVITAVVVEVELGLQAVQVAIRQMGEVVVAMVRLPLAVSISPREL